MAREAFRSLYGDLTKLKDDSVLKDPAGGTGDDDELFQLLLAVSDWVDHWCNRHFYKRIEILEFDGNGQKILMVPDLIDAVLVQEDTNGDLTYDTSWATNDYFMMPHNSDPNNSSHWGLPYTHLKIRENGTKDLWTLGEKNFRLNGAAFGYRYHTEDSGTDVNENPFAQDDTTLTVDDGTQFAIGQTIVIDNEQMLITGISTNDLTVTRGLNGTDNVSHIDDSDISISRWPPAVERAALIQTARIWTRAADFEPFFVDADVDTDVRLLLEPYRKLAA